MASDLLQGLRRVRDDFDSLDFDSREWTRESVSSSFAGELSELEDVPWGGDEAFGVGDKKVAAKHGNGGLLIEEFKSMIESCRGQEKMCAQDSLAMLKGDEVNIHEMMANLKKAELQTQLVSNVTSKAVGALDNILKISV